MNIKFLCHEIFGKFVVVDILTLSAGQPSLLNWRRSHSVSISRSSTAAAKDTLKGLSHEMDLAFEDMHGQF
jgi:hypothetical protein